jgi:hypothetical protein
MKVVSLLLLVLIANAYVFAAPAGNASEANGKALLGRLVTTSNRPIIVNGGEAITGAIIVSGTQLVTPAAAGASVQLDNLGTVTIAPASTVSVAFDSKNLMVNVITGYASVATVNGVNGTVTGLPANGGPTAPTPAISHPEYWGVAGVAIGSAALIWAIISHNRANDARDSANAANAAAASLASQLAALRTCLAGQTTSPVKLCTSF